MTVLVATAPRGRHSDVFWTRVFLFGASCVAGLIIARRRKLRRFHLHILNAKSADCGRLFGLDIGGTLAKMVYFQSADGAAAAQRRQMERQLNRSDPLTASERRSVEGSLPLIDDCIMDLHATDEAQREERLQMFVPELGGTIHFINFPTAKMDEITDFVRRRFFHRYIKKIACTGGGAFKFSPLFESRLGIELQKTDEMDALIQGLNFVLRNAPNECYTFVDVVPDTHGLGNATKKLLPKPSKDDLYPFLLVNIGSGVSILKITGESQYERVSGTSLGGGTFLGLCRALSKLRTFDEAMDASVEGDSNEVDMTVGDIYGAAGYEQFQLKPDTVASSFGKAGAPRLSHPPRDADLARSLLFMITQNLGQLAFLNARRVETKRIYFSGNFLRRNELACRQLAYAISFWSKGEMQAQFFHHEGFFGALGTFLQRFNSIPESQAVSETEQESTSNSEAEAEQSSSKQKRRSGGGSSWSFGDDSAPAPTGRKRFNPSQAPTPQQQDAKMESPRAAPAVQAPTQTQTAAPVSEGAVRVALLKTSSDAELVDRVVQNCFEKLEGQSVSSETFTVASLEQLPYAANKLTAFGGFDAVICFGFLNAQDPQFPALSAALTQSFIDISVKNGRPVVRAVFVGEPRVASVKVKGGWGAEFADGVVPLVQLGGFKGSK